MSPSRPPQPSVLQLIGKRLLKDFADEVTGEMKPFSGTIKSFYAKGEWFRVVYDDGDREDVDMKTILPLVKRAEKAEAAKQAPAPAARGAIPSSGASGSRSPARRKEASISKITQRKRKAPSNAKRPPNPKRPVSIFSTAAATPVPEILAPAVEAAVMAPSGSRPPPTRRLPPTQPTQKRSKKNVLPPADDLEIPEIDTGVRYAWPPGEEPWRKCVDALQIPVSEDPIMDAASVKVVHHCKQKYYRQYRKAEEDEKARVEAAGFFVNGKRLMCRPDRVTESWMKKEGYAANQDKRAGHVPGVGVNQRFYARSELSCVGMHGPPIAGIDYLGKDRTGLGISLAVSVVCAGWYEDDGDAGNELIYTGEGGNDLLGSRKQVEGQKLERGNAALVGNIRLGLPVRVVRKNKDPNGIYGCVLIYDGLYDVVEYWKSPGKEGHDIFQFRLVRRSRQGELLSQAVRFGGVSAPKQLTALSRPGVVDLDISGGKEPRPIPAMNEADDNELPPCSALERVPKEEQLRGANRGISKEALEELERIKWEPSVEYVTSYVYMPGIDPPAPATLPPQFAESPHDYIRQLDHGRLPYVASKHGKLLQLRELLPVVYECGPWANCPLGTDCPQAATQSGLKYRLEVFKTRDGRGWGVRSLDMIPQFAHYATILEKSTLLKNLIIW